jgi:hypothetical protein
LELFNILNKISGTKNIIPVAIRLFKSYGTSTSPSDIKPNHIAIEGIIEYGGIPNKNKYGLSNEPFL